MMNRRPILCISIGICAFFTAATPALAWGDKDCKTVRLPGQKVVIQTGEPNVSTRGIAARGTTLGTLYMPLNLPLTGFGGVADSRGIADDSLSKAIEAEQHSLRAATAKAAFKAEIEYKLALFKKLSSLDNEVTSSGESLDKSIQEINKRLETLDKQLTAVEQLLIIHDNYLQDKLKKEPEPMTKKP